MYLALLVIKCAACYEASYLAAWSSMQQLNHIKADSFWYFDRFSAGTVSQLDFDLATQSMYIHSAETY